MWDGREFYPEFNLWSTKMYLYTFVSGSEKLNNKTGFSVTQFFRMQNSLSLTMISCGHTHRLGFVISYTTTGSPLAFLVSSLCYQHDPYNYISVLLMERTPETVRTPPHCPSGPLQKEWLWHSWSGIPLTLLASAFFSLFSRGFFEAEGPLKWGHVPDLPFKWLKEEEEMLGSTVSVQSRKKSQTFSIDMYVSKQFTSFPWCTLFS